MGDVVIQSASCKDALVMEAFLTRWMTTFIATLGDFEVKAGTRGER